MSPRGELVRLPGGVSGTKVQLRSPPGLKILPRNRPVRSQSSAAMRRVCDISALSPSFEERNRHTYSERQKIGFALWTNSLLQAFGLQLPCLPHRLSIDALAFLARAQAHGRKSMWPTDRLRIVWNSICCKSRL
jgi:hypothetical protein